MTEVVAIAFYSSAPSPRGVMISDTAIPETGYGDQCGGKGGAVIPENQGLLTVR